MSATITYLARGIREITLSLIAYLLLHLTFQIHLWFISLNPITLRSSLHVSLMYFTQHTGTCLDQLELPNSHHQLPKRTVLRLPTHHQPYSQLSHPSCQPIWWKIKHPKDECKQVWKNKPVPALGAFSIVNNTSPKISSPIFCKVVGKCLFNLQLSYWE